MSAFIDRPARHMWETDGEYCDRLVAYTIQLEKTNSALSATIRDMEKLYASVRWLQAVTGSREGDQ